jgi:omega-6 fatty acid desaturase (delta-12 desaturase)
MDKTGSGGGKERRRWRDLIAPFEAPSLARSLWQLVSTLLAYAALEAAMYVSLGGSYWLTLALAVPTAGMTVRLFIFQHDCGHRAFFRSQQANAAAGRLCSLFTYTPFACWRRQHAQHHASFNNLDRRDTGLDIYSNCATLQEYQALPLGRRFLHRASRHPLLTLLATASRSTRPPVGGTSGGASGGPTRASAA